MQSEVLDTTIFRQRMMMMIRPLLLLTGYGLLVTDTVWVECGYLIGSLMNAIGL